MKISEVESFESQDEDIKGLSNLLELPEDIATVVVTRYVKRRIHVLMDRPRLVAEDVDGDTYSIKITIPVDSNLLSRLSDLTFSVVTLAKTWGSNPYLVKGLDVAFYPKVPKLTIVFRWGYDR